MISCDERSSAGAMKCLDEGLKYNDVAMIEALLDECRNEE